MTTVELPRIGESVTEGTILSWLKKEGDFVQADEPLVEISTDKIDTELPAPVSGVLTKILVQPDQTVEVGTPIAEIEEGGRAASSQPAAKKTAPAPSPKAEQKAPAREEKPAQKEQPAARAESKPPRALRAVGTSATDGDQRAVLSPLVRRLADQMHVDLAGVRGTGAGGRITKQDVMNATEGGAQAPAAPTAAALQASPGSQQVEFTRVRRAIAEHMVRSKRTSAHVTDVVEVDMTAVAALRERAKGAFKGAEGFSLTFLPFIASALIAALREHPEFNAHVDPESAHATIFREVNLGIAVGRDEGLIVPVVHGADGLNLTGLARAIHDVATRARTKGGLKPDDVAGGTFTISNGGSFGSLIFTPIINQPQAAVLGLGAVVKRPAVVTVGGNDAIAIRHLMYQCLSYDHRWIDGHKATQFNSAIKKILEEADFAPDLGLPRDRDAGGE